MNIVKEYPMEIGYDGHNVEGDWWIKIIIPKQPNWYDTQAIAKEVKKAYEMGNMIEHNRCDRCNKKFKTALGFHKHYLWCLNQ